MVWPRRPDAEDPRATVRRAAIVRLLVAVLIALLLNLYGYETFALVVVGLAVLLASATLVSRQAARMLRRLETGLAQVVGAILAWTLLAPFFYMVVTPFGLLTRRGRRDRLARRPDAGASTYWRTRERESSLDKPY